jgi:hypothetical protein
VEYIKTYLGMKDAYILFLFAWSLFLIKHRGLEGFRSDLIRELINGDVKLLEASPSFIEGILAAILCFILGGHFNDVDALGMGPRLVLETIGDGQDW